VLIYNKLKHVLLNSKSFVKRHPLLILFLLLVLTSIFVFFQFLFKNQVYMYSGIGSDTINIYYPFFSSLETKFQTGDFTFWDFSHGLGTNALTRQADVGSIFTYLTILFGAENIKYSFCIVKILIIFLSGFACYFYLNNFDFSQYSKIISSYIFAFNGFIMLWGQHYFFAIAPLYTVLSLFAIEKAFKTKKGYLLVAFITFLIAVTSYYFAYMILIFGAFYTLFRLIYIYPVKEIKTASLKIISLLFMVLLGIGMAAVLFLPSVNLVTSTSARLNDGTGLIEKIRLYLNPLYFDKATIKMIVTRLLSNNLTGTEGYIGPLNYYEAPQWFFTSFILFFTLLFVGSALTDKTESIKRKILKLISVIICVALAFHPLFSVILNGFSAPFFRYTYLLMSLLALMFSFVLDKIICKKLNFAVPLIILSSALTMLILAVVFIHLDPLASTGKKLVLIYGFMAFCLTVFLVILQKRSLPRLQRILSLICILGIVVLNINLESYVTTNSRLIVSQDNEKIYQKSGNNNVASAIEYINNSDPSFFRTEKTFDDIAFLNDSMLQGYYGVSVYNSVINKDIIYFSHYVCPEFKGDMPTGYYDFRNVYENQVFASILGVKYILSDKPIDTVQGYEYITSFGDVLLYKNTLTDGIGSFYNKTISLNEFLSINDEEKNNLLKDTLILDSPSVFMDSSSEKSTVMFNRPEKSNIIEGHADIKENGYIFIPIPYEDGWHAYVDGVELKITKANIAFCAINVYEGQHTILLKYQTPLIIEGTIISCICFAIFVCISIFLLKKNRGNYNDSL